MLLPVYLSHDQNVMLHWPTECSGDIDNTIGMMQILVLMVSQDQNNFNPLDLRSVMVPLMMLSTSYDSDTSAVASHDINNNAMLYLISIV